eukprot:scaffold119522_cov18-Tisochrysis_lutea.AAC.2
MPTAPEIHHGERVQEFLAAQPLLTPCHLAMPMLSFSHHRVKVQESLAAQPLSTGSTTPEPINLELQAGNHLKPPLDPSCLEVICTASLGMTRASLQPYFGQLTASYFAGMQEKIKEKVRIAVSLRRTFHVSMSKARKQALSVDTQMVRSQMCVQRRAVIPQKGSPHAACVMPHESNKRSLHWFQLGLSLLSRSSECLHNCFDGDTRCSAIEDNAMGQCALALGLAEVRGLLDHPGWAGNSLDMSNHGALARRKPCSCPLRSRCYLAM